LVFTDKKIDALVYELYGLSEDEMKIVGAEMGDITVAPTRAQNMA